jgi:hypothetical protein
MNMGVAYFVHCDLNSPLHKKDDHYMTHQKVLSHNVIHEFQYMKISARILL